MVLSIHESYSDWTWLRTCSFHRPIRVLHFDDGFTAGRKKTKVTISIVPVTLRGHQYIMQLGLKCLQVQYLLKSRQWCKTQNGIKQQILLQIRKIWIESFAAPVEFLFKIRQFSIRIFTVHDVVKKALHLFKKKSKHHLIHYHSTLLTYI